MEQPTSNLPPELARGVLTGDIPLSKLFGLSTAQLAEMANRGYQYWQQGRRSEARRAFKALVALDEKLYYGHAGLGLLAMHAGDMVEAEAFLRRAVELQPRDPSVVSNLGEVLLQRGKLEEALRVLGAAAELSPNHPGSVRARAILEGIAHNTIEQVKQVAGN